MKTSDFDYELPPERIAQEPLEERDASRLLVLDRSSGSVAHRAFRELPSLLRQGDLLVLNDTKVVPARLYGRREATGGGVEVLFVERLSGANWLALTKSGGSLRPGERLSLAEGRVRARIVERRGQEGDVLEILSQEPLERVLDEAGHMPVPPYIRRDGRSPPSALDRLRYQTVYARSPGAVAAPTAGLHFTERVFRELEARGVAREFVTLRVGPGTFRPVKAAELESHRMDPEDFEVPERTAEAIRLCRGRGGRVVAVGTTVVRALESAAAEDGTVRPGRGRASIFIVPGHRFRAIDAMLTNFHLPRGTPLVLVCAFAGRERVLAAYREALRAGYRFLSYGDAMLIV